MGTEGLDRNLVEWILHLDTCAGVIPTQVLGQWAGYLCQGELIGTY